MPLVQAWQCPQTGKFFAKDDVKKYRKHLRTQAKIRWQARVQAKALAEWEAKYQEFRMSVFSFVDIEQWVINNMEFLWAKCPDYRRGKPGKYDVPVMHEFKFNAMRWQMHCSNSHSAPRGRVTNWGNRNPSKPTGYPGWRGYVKWRISDWERWDTNPLQAIGVQTGSGGGGTNGSYDVTLYAEDFPNLVFGSVMRGELSAASVRGLEAAYEGTYD